MEIQSRRLHDAAARGAMDVCLDARNAGGAVTFVPQDAPVRHHKAESLLLLTAAPRNRRRGPITVGESLIACHLILSTRFEPRGPGSSVRRPNG